MYCNCDAILILSCAPVLDIQSRHRYSYSLSPYVFSCRNVPRYTPLIPGKTNQIGGAGVLQLKLPSGGNRAIGANCSYSIAICG